MFVLVAALALDHFKRCDILVGDLALSGLFFLNIVQVRVETEECLVHVFYPILASVTT